MHFGLVGMFGSSSYSLPLRIEYEDEELHCPPMRPVLLFADQSPPGMTTNKMFYVSICNLLLCPDGHPFWTASYLLLRLWVQSDPQS